MRKNNNQISKFYLILFSLLVYNTAIAQKTILFNGQNLSGWVIENNGQFSVDNGLLKLNQGTGWLRTEKTFGDYVLIMKFRFLDVGANSGIFVRTASTSKNDDNGWPDNGYQIQCKDTILGDVPLGILIPYGAPPFEHSSDLALLKQAYKSTGKWHTYKIICKGEELLVYLNNKLITTATSIKNLEGHIGIQGEHGRLEFKKIYLKKLKR